MTQNSALLILLLGNTWTGAVIILGIAGLYYKGNLWCSALDCGYILSTTPDHEVMRFSWYTYTYSSLPAAARQSSTRDSQPACKNTSLCHHQEPKGHLLHFIRFRVVISYVYQKAAGLILFQRVTLNVTHITKPVQYSL